MYFFSVILLYIRFSSYIFFLDKNTKTVCSACQVTEINYEMRKQIIKKLIYLNYLIILCDYIVNLDFLHDIPGNNKRKNNPYHVSLH